MDLAVREPKALGGSTGTWPGVGTNPSNIKYHHPKAYQCSDGKESTYIFSEGMHKQRSCMPMAARTTEEKIRTSSVPNYPLMGK